METERSIDSVIAWFVQAITNKEVIPPHLWVEAAASLNVLRESVDDQLFTLQQNVAKQKMTFIENGYSVAKAKARVEIEDIYKEMCMAKAKVERIEEFIKISKLMARMKSDEIKSY